MFFKEKFSYKIKIVTFDKWPTAHGAAAVEDTTIRHHLSTLKKKSLENVSRFLIFLK